MSGLAEISKTGNLGKENVALRTNGGVAESNSLRLIVPLIRIISI